MTSAPRHLPSPTTIADAIDDLADALAVVEAECGAWMLVNVRAYVENLQRRHANLTDAQRDAADEALFVAGDLPPLNLIASVLLHVEDQGDDVARD